MILAEDDDLATLRKVAREFFDADDVVAPESGSVQWERARWVRACAELGLAGVSEPEELGGAGFGFAALAVVVEEAGRALTPLPILSSVVLGQGLLGVAGDDSARSDLLPALIDGSRTATVVTSALRGDDAVPDDSMTATGSADTWAVTGRAASVLDGASADWVFVRAETPGGPTIFVVDTAESNVVRVVQDSMDLTRTFARIEFDHVPARLVGPIGAADDILASLGDVVAVALACEQLGGAEAALSATVEYVGQRVQFGREIGSFQAVKHRCADLAIALDDARSAVAHATWALHVGDDALQLAAPLAAVVCGRTFVDCAKENVHLHGGIGFTWEHSAHLYLRRAVTDSALFGSVERHYEQILTAHGVHEPR